MPLRSPMACLSDGGTKKGWRVVRRDQIHRRHGRHRHAHRQRGGALTVRRDDKLFRISGRWALASDGLQWVLLRQKRSEKWGGVSFVRSTKDVLARCMREKGTPPDDQRRLLDGLSSYLRRMVRGFSRRGHPGGAIRPPPGGFSERGTGLTSPRPRS